MQTLENLRFLSEYMEGEFSDMERMAFERFLDNDNPEAIVELGRLKQTRENSFNNQYVLKRIQETKEADELKAIQELKKITPLDDEVLKEIYKKCISMHQSKNHASGVFLENSILEEELQKNAMPYKKQVTIDNRGIIIGIELEKVKRPKLNGTHKLDFVVGDVQVGKSITEYIVISCKKSCRERWKQDGWNSEFPPRLFILLTATSDYPKSKQYNESETRKIITCSPKRDDDRIYKLNYEDLINELQVFIQV